MGHDLHSAHNAVIGPYQRQHVNTGNSARPPKGSYIRIAPRSGQALRSGINVLAGVIDPDYTGDIGVILHDTSGDEYIAPPGKKIAQLILENNTIAKVLEVNTLPTTKRNEQ